MELDSFDKEWNFPRRKEAIKTGCWECAGYKIGKRLCWDLNRITEGDPGWLVPQVNPKNGCYKYPRDMLGER
jgi:hypothetical protein